MQFHHAHAFRPQVAHALEAELPEAMRLWLAAGAEPVRLRLSDGSEIPMGMRSRRATFERAVRGASLRQPRLLGRRGDVVLVIRRRGRAAGICVDGAELPADLVIDASGRAGRVTRSLRAAPVSGGPCGIAYVDRQYQLLPGAEPGPLANPIVWQAELDGYQVLIFVHENGIFSVLLARPIADPVLARLRHEAAFTAACRAIPGLADWVDPGRAAPLTPVLPGGPLLNAYRGQRGPDGRLALPGLIFAGDAVATTTPTFGPRHRHHRHAGAGTAPAHRRARHRHRRDRGEASIPGAASRSSRGSTTTPTWTRQPGSAGRARTPTCASPCHPTAFSPRPRPTPASSAPPWVI